MGEYGYFFYVHIIPALKITFGYHSCERGEGGTTFQDMILRRRGERELGQKRAGVEGEAGAAGVSFGHTKSRPR